MKPVFDLLRRDLFVAMVLLQTEKVLIQRQISKFV